MVLSGGLSNHPLGDLVQCLTDEALHKTQARSHKRKSGWPDGRRKFGTVSGAIVNVLSAADSELPVKAIRAAVEGLLGGPVSRFSVADYLRVRSSGPRPLLERIRHGHYRLLR